MTIDLDGQYRALREEAGFFMPERGVLRVRGAESLEYLQGQLTNDVEALAPGAGCYAALLDRKGRMQADMRVLNLGDEGVWLDLEPEATSAALAHLRMYSVGRELEIEDATDRWQVLSLIGPRAGQLCGFEALRPEYAQRRRVWDGVEVIGVGTRFGVDVLVAAGDAISIMGQLRSAGVAEVAEDAAEILRVEAGIPRFGREMTTVTIPQEAGINERAVSFTKGCYIGQETVARLHYKGKPNRQLRGLRLEHPAQDGDPVTFEGREVGRIGSAVVSPAHGPVALAILRREVTPGDRVLVSGRIAAEVAEVPLSQ